MTDLSIADAKRLIAAASPEAARLLGPGISGLCSQNRYNIAARAALADPESQLTIAERRAIAAFMDHDGAPDVRDTSLHIRVSKPELARVAARAEAAGMSISEYVRGVLAEDGDADG